MVIVEIEPSARLAGQARDPAYTTAEETLPRGKLAMPDWPRAGDGITWEETGRHYTVQHVTWVIGKRKPSKGITGTEVTGMLAVLD
jgi:hypothetical protein